MAIKNLFNELEDLMGFLFPVTEYYPMDYKDVSKQGTKMPKSGSGDPLRKLMAKELHHFRITVKMTVDDIKNASYRKTKGQSGNHQSLLAQKGVKRQNDLKVLEDFARDLVDLYNKKIGNIDDIAGNGIYVNTTRGGYSPKSYINITVAKGHTHPEGGSKVPYRWLSEKRTKWGNELINSNTNYEKLFFGRTGGRVKSFGDLEDIGHRVGVVEGKGSVALSRLDSVTARIEDNIQGNEVTMGEGTAAPGQGEAVPGGTFLEKDLQVLQATRMQAQLAFMDLGINFRHYRKAHVKGGKLVDTLEIECDLEGKGRNELNQANTSTGMGLSERDIGIAIKETLDNLIADLKTYYAIELGGSKVTHRSSSPSFMLTIRNMLLSNPSIAKLRKAGRVKSTIKKFEEPKTINPRRTKPISIRFNSASVDHGTMSGHPAIKAEKSISKGAPRPSTGRNLSSLPALINMKLGATVVENMGAPGLENRTGTFASSARVVSAVPGPGGPALSYTYNKNPYEVFEMGGRGRRPWATTGRDPRTVIDKSIREIAAEMALGALTTRRV